ncbi:hypothetical protein GCM10010193_33080 [Kitasatospora atroaurantiaca]|uniref:Caspase domain-containing protein n=1 Tax=Kitasatospora atroaurantiaca TaxID=285545 RepID=A0A561ERP0_9ACTN|nr:caspase family protein [Kitasatospora atroaurantiaca]TWE18283.1 caspase domain-containing protein [Kitasatospora atroaurantiaca]
MAKRALVLAAETYDDSRFAPLPGAASDAEQLRDVLGDPAIGGFEVNVLSDASTQEWKIAIELFFSSATSDDTLLLHLSCHGRKNRRNQLHFITKDSKFDALAATSVEADFIAARMEESRSRRIILLLDCCYSGAFNKGMRTRGDQEEVELKGTFEGSGRIVITSSTSLQYSYETAPEDDLASRQEGQASVFTSAVVHGLRTGDADLDEDGFISADELYRFISRWVPEQVSGQTPTLSVTSAEGERFELARNPRAAELADRALRRAVDGDGELTSPIHQLALKQAGIRAQESEAKAAELNEQIEKAKAEAARNNTARAWTSRQLSRSLGLLFSIIGGVAGMWTASFWMSGFTLPSGGGKFLALAICAVALYVSFVVVILATITATAFVGAGLGSLIKEEEPFAYGEPTRRKVLWGILVGATVALAIFVFVAEVIWLVPAALRLGEWISGQAGFPIGLPTGGDAFLVAMSGSVGAYVVAAVTHARTPNEEVIEETGPGYLRRVTYKKFGPFRWTEEYKQNGGSDFDFL